MSGPIVHLPGPDHAGSTDPVVRYLALPHPGTYTAEVTVRGYNAAARLGEANWLRHVETWTIRLIATVATFPGPPESNR